MVSTSAKVVLWIVALFVFGFSIADIVYFERIKSGKTLTKGECNSMIGVNGVLLVASIAMIGVLIFMERHNIHNVVKRHLHTR